MKKILITGVLATAVFASHSFAGVNEVKICAGKLPKAAQKVLVAVAPKLKPGVDARKVMKSTVISMVKSGEIERSEARSSARAAGKCLRKFQD